MPTMHTYRANPTVSGWLVRWDTRIQVRAYDQYPELRVEAGVPLVMRCLEHPFRAGVRVDGDTRVVPLEFTAD